ncbi:MAG: S8/S53 family peptidase, partial [Candidatus Paceibacterota bacterium]
GNTMYRKVTQGDGGVIFVLDTSISNELTIDYNLIDSLCVSVDGLCKGFDGGRVNSEVHAELVSGIAAGKGYKGGGTGVAPEAGVVNVEVWHPRDPRGYNSADVIAAVYKVALAEAYNHSPGEFRAFAINYSGAEYVDYSGSNCDEVNFVFQRIAAMTRTKGVPFFAAAGNDSVPKAGWPACSSLVQAVTGSDRIRPEKGEIVHAQPIDPTDLTLAQANEAYIWKADGDVWGLGGTSVSTPLVTAQALLYQLASQKYRGITLTPSEIYAFMAQYGDKVPYADYTGYAWAARIDNIFRNMGFMPYARLVFPSITQSRIQ